jgi:hypothetical protein
MADPIDIMRHNAEWADTFEGGTTNLALRRRHKQDEVDYAHELTNRREMMAAQEVQSDRVKQNFYFKEKQAKLNEELARERLNRDREMHEATLGLRVQQERTAAAAERAKLSTINSQEEIKRQSAEDTHKFSESVAAAAKLHRAGTPEYTQAVAQARLDAPAVDKVFFDDIWKTTNSELPPDEVVKQARAVREQLPNATTTVSANGGVSVTQRAPGEHNPERKTLMGLRDKAMDDLASLTEKSAKASSDKERQLLEQRRPMLEQRAKGYADELAAMSAPAAPAVATQGDPRLALAQKALSDPSASEAHKAAARKILGQ